jgi:hypothetical protein
VDVEAVAAKIDELDPDQSTNDLVLKFLEFMQEPETEPKGELSKTLVMLRRVIRDRLQRRRPPEAAAE